MEVVKNFENNVNFHTIVGLSGSGKTYLSNFHKGEKLLFSFDNSYNSIKGFKDNYTLVVVKKDDLIDLSKLASDMVNLVNNSKAELVIFDNLSALELNYVDAYKRRELGNSGADGRQAYLKIQEFVRMLREKLINDVKRKVDVMFTFWIEKRDVYDEEGKLTGTEDRLMSNMQVYNAVAGFSIVKGVAVKGFGGTYQIDFKSVKFGKNTVNDLDIVPASEYWQKMV